MTRHRPGNTSPSCAWPEPCGRLSPAQRPLWRRPGRDGDRKGVGALPLTLTVGRDSVEPTLPTQEARARASISDWSGPQGDARVARLAAIERGLDGSLAPP